MEVLLKKTKITKSIINQSLPAPIDAFLRTDFHYDVLGWCMYNGKKIVLLYEKATNQVRTYFYTPSFGKKYQFLERANVQRRDTNPFTRRPDINGGWVFPEVCILNILDEDGIPVYRHEQNEMETDEKMKELEEKAMKYAVRVAQAGQIYI
jgi:hypothetical protein